eukprot:1739224-Rhodomonas_salina.1
MWLAISRAQPPNPRAKLSRSTHRRHRRRATSDVSERYSEPPCAPAELPATVTASASSTTLPEDA